MKTVKGSVLEPFVRMANATAHLPHTESLIARTGRDESGQCRVFEITVEELRDLVEWAKDRRS